MQVYIFIHKIYIYFIMYFYNYIFHHAHRHYETLRVAGEARPLVPPSWGGAECRTNSQTLRNPQVTRGWMQNHPPTRGHPLASGLPSPMQHALPAAAFARMVERLIPASVLRQKNHLSARNSPSGER